MIDGFFAFICLEVDLRLVGLDGAIVDQDLVPRTVSVGGARRYASLQLLAAFVSRVGINNHAAVSEPLVVHDLADLEVRRSSIVFAHLSPLAVTLPGASPEPQYLIWRKICV